MSITIGFRSPFGPRLRQLREQQELTPESLAALAELHPQTVRKLETEQRLWPRLDTALALARALGITVDQLAGAGPVRQRPQAR